METPKDVKLRFLPEALYDLEEIVSYISVDSPNAALRTRDKILKCADNLTVFPEIGRRVSIAELRDAGFRTLVAAPYILFYRIVGSDVVIHRVVHGRRDLNVILQNIKNKRQT